MIFAVLMMLQAVTATQVSNVERELPEIRARFNTELIDYPSARFRDVHVARNPVAEAERGQPGTGYLCGFVNSKNRMGGYVGWKKFMAGAGSVWLEGDSVADIVIGGSCGTAAVYDGVDRSAWLLHR
jgi:hypothetical protein